MKREDQYHFDVRGLSFPTDVGVVELACRRCRWATDTDETITLADLIDRGQEHLDDLHGGAS